MLAGLGSLPNTEALIRSSFLLAKLVELFQTRRL
jgi:hypothetical protein